MINYLLASPKKVIRHFFLSYIYLQSSFICTFSCEAKPFKRIYVMLSLPDQLEGFVAIKQFQMLWLICF